MLADLARHPATAAHVARKLARHFVADEPPPALVERLAKRFLDTDGDLKQIAKALIEAPETWSEQRSKLKRPSEWLISAWRAIGVAPEPRADPRVAWPIWASGCGGRRRRKGFPDEQAAWIDGLAQRLDIANRIAERVAERVEPAALHRNGARAAGFGRHARKPSRAPRAGSRRLTLALMAPEFQRR